MKRVIGLLFLWIIGWSPVEGKGAFSPAEARFAEIGEGCSALSIEVSADRLRRCYRNLITIRVQNRSQAASYGVQAYLKLPSYVHFISSSIPYVYHPLDTSYSFFISEVPGNGDTNIQLVDSVACVDGLMGREQCIKTWLSYGATCLPSTQGWGGPDLEAFATCRNEIPSFKIRNRGASMPEPGTFNLFLDSSLALIRSFQLGAGDSLLFSVNQARNHAVRLEVQQPSGHPQGRFAVANSTCSALPLTFVWSPSADGNPEISQQCMRICDSYDPNDKAVTPRGLTAQGRVPPGNSLEYMIRFQNTGTAPANKVVVSDTLDTDLDMSTFEHVASSHPFILKIGSKGQRVITWTFLNINLPDSNTSEPGSHGFVSFRIYPKESAILGARIYNAANIYFDFNPPVRTNTTLNTLYLYGLPPIYLDSVTVNLQQEKESVVLQTIYPNPSNGEFSVSLREKSEAVLYQSNGQKVMSVSLHEGANALDLTPFGKGLYLIRLSNRKGTQVEKIRIE